MYVIGFTCTIKTDDMIFIGRYSFKVERKNEKFSRDVKFYECHKIVKYRESLISHVQNVSQVKIWVVLSSAVYDTQW